MKIESPEFTKADFDSFLTQSFERERKQLVDRLTAIVEEAEKLLPSIEGAGVSEQDQWTTIETLAHMAVTSQFFGWLAHEIATTKKVEGDILEMLKLRDLTIKDAAQMPPESLAQQLRQNLERTIAFVETVPFEDLRTQFDFLGRRMTAEDILRITLSAHLEDHLEQIRTAIG